jgi:hypothetical protein
MLRCRVCAKKIFKINIIFILRGGVILTLQFLHNQEMRDFNGKITVDEETLYFAFNQIYSPEEEKIFVTVNKDRHFFIFTMSKKKSHFWQITGSVPTWIMDLETQLSEIIVQNIDSPQ